MKLIKNSRNTITWKKTLILLMVWGALVFNPSQTSAGSPGSVIDSLAAAYAHSVWEAINRQESKNNFLIATGQQAQVEFIIDMRNYFNDPQNPALNSKPFVEPSVRILINQQINEFYQTYRHPFYIILSPIYARALDPSFVNKLTLRDVFDFNKEAFEQFRKRYEVYLQKLREQKHGLFPASLEDRANDGAILDIESRIFFRLSDLQNAVEFNTSLIISQSVTKASQIEKYYQQQCETSKDLYVIPYRHEQALKSYTKTILDAFKSHYSPYKVPQTLAEQISSNRATLSLPVYVMVRSGEFDLIQEKSDRLYLDDWEQILYDTHLGTTGGSAYFDIDQEGYIDATAIRYEPQKANTVTTGVEVLKIIRDAVIGVKTVADLIRVVKGDYLQNNEPITKLLENDAKNGTLTGVDLIRKASGARTQIYNDLLNGNYSADDLRVRIFQLYDLTNTLKNVFDKDSKYPFDKLTLSQIRVQSVTSNKIEPADPEKTLLDYLESRIKRGDVLSDNEKKEYFRLLCKLKGDCRQGSPLLGTSKNDLYITGYSLKVGGQVTAIKNLEEGFVRMAQTLDKAAQDNTFVTLYQKTSDGESVFLSVQRSQSSYKYSFFSRKDGTFIKEEFFSTPASALVGKYTDAPVSSHVKQTFVIGEPAGTFYLCQDPDTKAFYSIFRRDILSQQLWFQHQNNVTDFLLDNYSTVVKQVKIRIEDANGNVLAKIIPDNMYFDEQVQQWQIVDAKFSETRDLSIAKPGYTTDQKVLYPIISDPNQKIRIFVESNDNEILKAFQLTGSEREIFINRKVEIYYNKGSELVQQPKLFQ